MSALEQRRILLDKYFDLDDRAGSFEELAFQIFEYQASENPVYKEYLQLLGIQKTDISKLYDIPALPIQFYKSHRVISGDFEGGLYFESSGTTDMVRSQHIVRDEFIYKHSCKRIFEEHFGLVSKYSFLALLPSYLERKHSSLVYMINYFISISHSEYSGFFLYDFEKLNDSLKKALEQGEKVVLFGVSFALLDFLEAYPGPYKNLIIIETGGMKGRKREMMKEDIIRILGSASGSQNIYSEYGMTELFSQFYAKDGLHFTPNRYAKTSVVQLNDPFCAQETGRPGLLKIYDLSNIDSCSFILTEDLARQNKDDQFELLGRADNSALRGCNLLYAG